MINKNFVVFINHFLFKVVCKKKYRYISFKSFKRLIRLYLYPHLTLHYHLIDNENYAK